MKDAFQKPRVQDTVDALAGTRYFSSFDLAEGYCHIRVREEDWPKSVFHKTIWTLIICALSNEVVKQSNHCPKAYEAYVW